jgi:hypothetical protein
MVPGRKPLVTLRDAALYITKLPKAEHDTEEWQAAMQALLLVIELGGPTMFARMSIMRALNRGHVRPVSARLATPFSPGSQASIPPSEDPEFRALARCPRR